MKRDSILKIILPGWGIAKEEYSRIGADQIVDYGFFGEGPALDLMKPDGWIDNIVPDQKYILIAHSMGTLFALRNSQLRDNAEAIYVFGGFAKFIKSDDNPFGKPAIEVAMMQKQLKRNPGLLLKRFYKSVAAPENIQISLPDILNVEQLTAGLELLKISDIRQELKEATTPLFILHGANDSIVSPKLAEYLQQTIDGAVLEIIKGSGHALAFTQYERINRKETVR